MGEMGWKYRKGGTNEVLGESPEDLKAFDMGEESTVQKEIAPKISSVEHLILKRCWRQQLVFERGDRLCHHHTKTAVSSIHPAPAPPFQHRT